MSAAPARAALTDTVAAAAPRSRRELFLAFTGLALQGFGGVVAVVQREMVERRRWMTREQFLDEWAVAQILPGPNVVNLSMMIGDRHFGTSGALVALAGILALPTLIVLALATLMTRGIDAELAQRALRGMGAVAAGMIVATGLKLASALRHNPMGWPVCAALAGLSFAAIAGLRWPLVAVLPTLGGAAWLWAWWRLGRGRAAAPITTARTTASPSAPAVASGPAPEAHEAPEALEPRKAHASAAPGAAPPPPPPAAP